MRKGYGPTGVSYTYTKQMFLDKVDSGPIKIVMIARVSRFTVELDLKDASADELHDLYKAIDSACYVEDDDKDVAGQVFEMFVGG